MIDTPVYVRSTRDSLLEAARSCLVRDGFERITTRRIAEAAGVNIATLHYYFGSKEALLDETMRFALDEVVQRIDKAVSAAQTLADALELGLAAYWEFVRDLPGVLRFDLAVRGFRDPVARQQSAWLLTELHRLTVEMLRGFAPADPDQCPTGLFEPIAHFLVASLDGITLHYLMTRDAAVAVRNMELLRRQVLVLYRESNAETV